MVHIGEHAIMSQVLINFTDHHVDQDMDEVISVSEEEEVYEPVTC